MTATSPVLKQIAGLPKLSHAELKALWREYFGVGRHAEFASAHTPGHDPGPLSLIEAKYVASAAICSSSSELATLCMTGFWRRPAR